VLATIPFHFLNDEKEGGITIFPSATTARQGLPHASFLAPLRTFFLLSLSLSFLFSFVTQKLSLLQAQHMVNMFHCCSSSFSSSLFFFFFF